MPKVRRSRKAPPEGWELIEPTLEELEQKMREGNLKIILKFLIIKLYANAIHETLLINILSK